MEDIDIEILNMHEDYEEQEFEIIPVQDEKTKHNCETRRIRDQYLKDHKEELLKLKHNQRIKKASELLKKDLNLNVNYNTLYSALKKYEIFNQE